MSDMTHDADADTRSPAKRSRISEVRRQDLIRAAITAISEVGYGTVTVQTICETAGFSRGLIGHYFDGKDALLLEAVQQITRELADATRAAVAAAGPDPLDRLHAVVTASFTPPGFTPEKVSVWVALAATARWSPELATIYRELWHDYRLGIARLVERAAKARAIEIDSANAALTFSQLIEGFWVGWAGDPVAVSAERAEAACHAYLDLLFQARR